MEDEVKPVDETVEETDARLIEEEKLAESEEKEVE